MLQSSQISTLFAQQTNTLGAELDQKDKAEPASATGTSGDIFDDFDTASAVI